MLRSLRKAGGTAGFTLLELAVTLAIIALVAGFIMTRMVGRTVDGEAAALSRNLASVAEGVTAFRNDVRRYPGRLSYLTTQPDVNALDSCGNPIPGRFREFWRGPYADRAIPTAGLPSGTSTIQDSISRTGPSATVMNISVEGVDQAVAELVDRSFEATQNLSDGTIRWTDAGGGRGTLTYEVPVRGC